MFKKMFDGNVEKLMEKIRAVFISIHPEKRFFKEMFAKNATRMNV